MSLAIQTLHEPQLNAYRSLIMLLVLGDLAKSLAFVVFPIVYFIHGPIRSESAFCQASGFFLALGVEASDIAIALIALHAGMYMIRPRSGLHPYRRIAFAAYFTLPFLVASLAFVYGHDNDNTLRYHAYANLGYYCYMRNNKSLALSWIPRYCVLVFIIVTYLCIYLCVMKRIKRYERRDSVVFMPKARSRRPTVLASRKSYSLSASRRASAVATAFRERFRSAPSLTGKLSEASTEHRALKPIQLAHAGEAITWKLPGFAETSTRSDDQALLEDKDPFSTAFLFSQPNTPPTESPAVSPLSPPPPARPRERRSSTTVVDSCRSSATMAPSIPAPFIKPNNTLVSTVQSSYLQNTPGQCTGRPTPPRPSATRFQSSQEATATLSHTRNKVRRQLRSLFVYPITYIIVWMFPLINHIMGYDTEKSDRDSPSWLLSLSLFSLSIQGLVDCVVFVWREKPWRHTDGVGFWDSLGNAFGWGCDTVGLSKDEMLLGAGLAKARRDGELAEEMQQGRRGRMKKIIRKSRHWWDVEEFVDDRTGGDIEEARPGRGSRAVGAARPGFARRAHTTA